MVTTVLAASANDAGARDSVPAEPSIVEVQQALAAGRFDVRALERHYETRINAIDRAGARINSVLEINPDAAQIAATLDTGAAWSEPRLIACAYAFEQASHARQPPHFPMSVP